MAETFFRKATRDDGTEIQVEIAVHSWGCAAHMGSMTYPGHPAEPPEIEIIDAWRIADENLPDAPRILDQLTEAEASRIETDFLENPPEPDYEEW